MSYVAQNEMNVDQREKNDVKSGFFHYKKDFFKSLLNLWCILFECMQLEKKQEKMHILT